MPKNTLQLMWPNKELALIPAETGRYGYRWVHPSDPRYCETHTLSITDRVDGTQAPKEEDCTYSERADLKPSTDNLLILGESGDVLEALTRVPELSDKYLGKVKCVYIDPPFNTAQTFANYEDNLQHSVWLTMMRDRLEHLHALLSDDGSIWVHLDDVENHRMRVLLDEVFGPENFISELIWQRKTSAQSDTSLISNNTDTILSYGKNKVRISFNGLARTASSESAYSNPDNDPRGPWREGDYKMPSGAMYPIAHPKTGDEVYPPEGMMWRYSELTHRQNLADDRLWWGRTNEYTYPKFKRFRSEVADTRIPENILLSEDVDTTRRAKQHMKKLFSGTAPFATPKPERLLERIIHIATNPGDIVLDVFAGSGTTAAVAHKMGRRWVTCELIEDTFTRFTKPRLTKVVNNEDDGGVTFTKDRELKPGAILPDKFDTDDMEDATKLLRAVGKDKEITDEQALAIKAVQKLIATKPSSVRNWRGGGGFTVAKLSPTCFDYDEEYDTATLTEEATGEVLTDSVCANMNYHRTPDHPDFDGVRGRMRLAVVEGTLTAELADELIAKLDNGDLLTIAATGVTDGVSAHLRTAKRGCVVTHIPGDLFQTRRVERTN